MPTHHQHQRMEPDQAIDKHGEFDFGVDRDEHDCTDDHRKDLEEPDEMILGIDSGPDEDQQECAQ